MGAISLVFEGEVFFYMACGLPLLVKTALPSFDNLVKVSLGDLFNSRIVMNSILLPLFDIIDDYRTTVNYKL